MTANNTATVLYLRDHRKARRLSQVQLAAASKVSQTYISEIERGEAEPSADVIERLAKAMNTNVWRLLHPPRVTIK